MNRKNCVLHINMTGWNIMQTNQHNVGNIENMILT